jgi:hypothetical protein
MALQFVIASRMLRDCTMCTAQAQSCQLNCCWPSAARTAHQLSYAARTALRYDAIASMAGWYCTSHSWCCCSSSGLQHDSGSVCKRKYTREAQSGMLQCYSRQHFKDVDQSICLQDSQHQMVKGYVYAITHIPSIILLFEEKFGDLLLQLHPRRLGALKPCLKCRERAQGCN